MYFTDRGIEVPPGHGAQLKSQRGARYLAEFGVSLKCSGDAKAARDFEEQAGEHRLWRAAG